MIKKPDTSKPASDQLRMRGYRGLLSADLKDKYAIVGILATTVLIQKTSPENINNTTNSFIITSKQNKVAPKGYR